MIVRYIQNLILVSLLFGSCTKKQNTSNHLEQVANDTIVEVDSLLNERPYLLKIDHNLILHLNNNTLDFKEIDGIDTIIYNEKYKSSNLINSNDSVGLSLFNVKDWDGRDPGDFRRIMISYQGSDYEFIDWGGWVSVPQKLGANQKYFIFTNIGLKNNILIFIGYTYASTPPLLSIVGFDDKGAHLIYNQNRSLVSVKNDELVVQDANGNYERIYGLEDQVLIQ
ncbi:MAG: hypothetical protein RLN88_12370 [Ekhidna sp.]|uniref:hypothetical protein n=1 Tax=Ekhidna sp. TaxID=2608089 RepID=UPI0032EEBB12